MSAISQKHVQEYLQLIKDGMDSRLKSAQTANLVQRVSTVGAAISCAGLATAAWFSAPVALTALGAATIFMIARGVSRRVAESHTHDAKILKEFETAAYAVDATQPHSTDAGPFDTSKASDFDRAYVKDWLANFKGRLEKTSDRFGLSQHPVHETVVAQAATRRWKKDQDQDASFIGLMHGKEPVLPYGKPRHDGTAPSA